MTLSKRDKKYIWHPFTQMQNAPPNISIVKGEGTYLFDSNNTKYIDAISSWWVTVHGHSHPYIQKKISEQFQELDHTIFAGFTHPKAVEIGERLLNNHLPEKQSKVFFSDNGSTAVEVALKMAIQYWHNKGIKKSIIIAFNNAYHGDTFGAMAISGRSIFTQAFHKMLFDVIYIDPPTPGHEASSIQQFKQAINNNDIAGFIFEPLVLGAGGMLMYEEKELDTLIEIAKENNIITIADEVMTGFGRTGKFFATDYLKNKPDIFCLSKGLTGGVLPMSITSCTDEIYKAFLSDDKTKTLFHGHSYTANPIACAAACASLDLFEEASALENRKRIELSHQGFFNEISEKYLNDTVRNIRQKGTIIALELNTNAETGYLNKVKEVASEYFLSKNIILRPLGNVIYILPPYCISNEDLAYIYDTIIEFLIINKSLIRN